MIYAIGIEFLGGNYRGWQRQAHLTNTVQETLETAFTQVANTPIEIIAAGRTDAGVHASHMIAHFATNAQRPPYNWLRGVNSLLPNDIAVHSIHIMPDDFHARFSATARRYHYITLPSTHRPAILHGQVTHHHADLDIVAMRLGCAQLLGWHNFTSFRAAACQSRQPVRHVLHASLEMVGNLLVLDITANGFLHHMVRNIMGALFAIGEHKLPPNAISELLHLQDRTQAPPTASPDGLYFVGASYPERFNAYLPTAFRPPIWLAR